MAVTVLTLTNTGAEPTTRTLTVSSPIATMPAALGSELTGTVTARYGLTTITPRLSGDGFAVSRTTLTRTVALDPGLAVTLEVPLGATTPLHANGGDPLALRQSIAANEPLRTGRYGKALTFTLSTTTP